MSTELLSAGASKALQALLAVVALSSTASAQVAPAPSTGPVPAQGQPPIQPGAVQPQEPGAPPQPGYPPTQYVYPDSNPKQKSSKLEIGTLYGMSVAYGVGLGLWFDAELGIDDAAVGAIPVAVLGLAAPIGVYFLDQPALPRGIPAAMSAGLFVGAGEGIGIATTQMARSDDAWGFRGLSRATVIGSTLGLAGGTALGFAYEPSPYSSLLVGSSVVWGSAIGSMFGLGARPGFPGPGRRPDRG
jgi:hypothetical protein